MTDETFPLPRQVADVDAGTHFLLKVHDDPPAGLGIAPGDWAIVRQQSSAAEDDIAVVMTGGNAVITTSAQEADPASSSILGVVVSVVHRCGRQDQP